MAAISNIGSTTTPRTEFKGEMPQPAASKRSFVPKYLSGVGATASADWANNAVTVSWKGVSATASLGRAMGAWPLRVEVSSVDTSDTRLMVDVQVLYTNGQREMKHLSLRLPVREGLTTVEPTKREDLDFSLNNLKLRYTMMNEKYDDKVGSVNYIGWSGEEIAVLKTTLLRAYRSLKAEEARLRNEYREQGQSVPGAVELPLRRAAAKVEGMLDSLDGKYLGPGVMFTPSYPLGR